MSRKIGINVITLLNPLALLLARDLGLAIKRARELRFDGVHAMPLWGIDGAALTGIKPELVLSFGTPWNGGPFWRALGRQAYLLNDEFKNPLLIDWFLFRGWKRSLKLLFRMREKFPKALFVENPNGIFKKACMRVTSNPHPIANPIIELCPEMSDEDKNLVYKEGQPICLNLGHLFRKDRRRRSQPPIVGGEGKELDRFLAGLQPGQVKLIVVRLEDLMDLTVLADDSVLSRICDVSPQAPLVLNASPLSSCEDLRMAAKVMRKL